MRTCGIFRQSVIEKIKREISFPAAATSPGKGGNELREFKRKSLPICSRPDFYLHTAGWSH